MSEAPRPAKAPILAECYCRRWRSVYMAKLLFYSIILSLSITTNLIPPFVTYFTVGSAMLMAVVYIRPNLLHRFVAHPVRAASDTSTTSSTQHVR